MSDEAFERIVETFAPGEVLEELTKHEKELAKKLAEWRSKLLTGSNILTMPPRRWLVPGWLPLDSVTALYSKPGVGKSFYALSVALEIARGGSWCGTRLEPTNVLYVAAERPTDIRDRGEAWCEHHARNFPENLVLFPEAPQLTKGNEHEVEALVALIRENEARVVILDTYARMTIGIEENSSKETGPVMESLSQIREATNGGLVLVVHHTGKDNSKGLRGSSAFLGAVDLSIELSPDGGALKSSVTKSNAGKEPLPEYYKLEPVTLDPIPGELERREAAVLIPTGAPALNPILEELILEVLGEEYFDGATRKQIHEALETRAESGELSKAPAISTLGRVLKQLVEAQKVTRSGSTSSCRYSLTKAD